MKITKYTQSCILVETNNKRILIDPGNINYEESLLNKEWANIDILLVTHKHADHCHIDAIKEIIKNKKTQFYTTNEVSKYYPQISLKIVQEGDLIKLDGVKIEVVKAIHGYIPLIKGDKEVNENVGYIIDDGKKRVYQTSDTICFKNNYKCNVLFVPVVNHGVVMGPWEAALFAKETGAELVIPFHYDSPFHPIETDKVKKEFTEHGINFKFLKFKETIKI